MQVLGKCTELLPRGACAQPTVVTGRLRASGPGLLGKFELTEEGMLICICDSLPIVNVTGLRRHHDTAGQTRVVFNCFLEWIYVGF